MSEYILDSEGIKGICNPNFDFRPGEDIYQRFRFPFEAVAAGSRIIIYGGGVVGKIFLQQISRSAYCSVRAICDRSPRASRIVEAPVIDVATLAGMPHDVYDAIVIAIEKRNIAQEIREDLIMAGIPSDRMIYVNPSTGCFILEYVRSFRRKVLRTLYIQRLICSRQEYFFFREYTSQIEVAPIQIDAFFQSDSADAQEEIDQDTLSAGLGFSADSRFQFPFDKVKKGARVVIYGGGAVGKTFVVQALSRKYVHLLAVCDRHPENIDIRTLPVLDFSQLSLLQPDTYDMLLVAIEDKNVADESIEDLLDAGIPQSKIHWYSPLKK